ncbi:MAG: glycine zipper 2TM domain-containing protein [Rhodoferax sp.]|uniref:glycine zipper 2TM domain-containing protein n=1 Tax=Rhodoferax sp. TaxID=50421 RepID=UPI001854C975|nr:glycine zipper 2TM domain-containing protein [Rhodoferax sp.]NMM14767.1 glycine zipper 2TM domain-containing protein [Rhodoferax sp.]
MSATLETPKSTSTVNKPLWAAVAVLGVAVVAMGATLLRIQSHPDEPRLAALSASAPAATPSGAAVPAPAATAPLEGGKTSASNKAVAPVKHAQTAPKYAANNNNRAAGTSAPLNHPMAPVHKPICANCGTIESVTPIQRDGTGSGGGAIAGGVLGAVVGNQVGAGNGKTLATILGALGGGFAGNTVEKKMKKETTYEVRVQMEDGSTRTVEQSSPASVGSKVIVEGNSLQAAGR